MRNRTLCWLKRIGVASILIVASSVVPDATWGAPENSSDIAANIRGLLAQPDSLGKGPVGNISSLRAFYEARSYAPVWVDGASSSQNNNLARVALAHAGEQGLNPDQYAIAVPGLQEPNSHAGSALRDVMTTSVVLAYARDLREGRPDLKAIDSDVGLPPQNYDASSALSSALQAGKLGAFLDELSPPQPQYRNLKDALRRYRAISDAGDWSILPGGKPDEYADGTLAGRMLRRRLAYEEPALASQPGTAGLSAAVKQFQLWHGLEPNGQVGPATLRELNVPASARAMQIAANMERWRWLPRSFEDNYIQINVPDAQLDMVIDRKIVLSSRVVVGRPRDPTPIMRAEGAGVTVNPPWTVPASIARREMLPKLKAHHDYLKAHEMILLDGPPGDPYGLRIDWDAVPNGTFPYRIQQKPGPENALGRIKIELPNKFDVYLHDTPAKSAFALRNRNLSHGCVRVEQILPLASYVLAANLSATKQIEAQVSLGERKYIPLKKTLPVYFLYWTAFSAQRNSVDFRADLYGRDKRLIAALGTISGAQRVSANYANCPKG